MTTGVYCWGENVYGQIGNSTTVAQLTPQRVTGSGPSPMDFTQVSAGQGHTCALTIDSAVYCWGAAFAGALGDQQEAVHRTTPVLAIGTGSAPLRFGSISAGSERTCGVTTGLVPQRIYCWGSNFLGFLGAGPGPVQSSVVVPTQVAAPAVDFRAVHTSYNTTCALDTSNGAWCWGRGVDGEMGNGLLNNQDTPVAVTASPGGFARLSTGGVNQCAVRVAAGGIYCWGGGDNGANGDGTAVRRLVPTRVVQ